MRPEWFALPPSVEESRSSRVASDALTELLPIPYDKMWDDDIHWLPLLIRGQRFVGRADCKENGDQFTMAKWWFGTLED
ncbi:hypothetical protein SERLADRAFT_378187 [Serpula lacrymans var. lacrymans S7.9]|uniref:Uncharacterized protein n=2 Tax=Serpula lacrymans var. lacrymans TaxID=341189 RepID=F8NGR7_SERL9|nr:uncharacterized protein SERLADRAFT_378187 [Serpula lacrymans var. lacrymans S7.9]EGO29400.1 hypothetical protein SERLADRAFT_378187 [Serpula lacrymans var. lacrymans S7.9]